VDAQITLEAYADENRALIHNGRCDEAIAICKHILRYYPKHVDTYRQMGEAYLEQGDLESAKELFRRVLSADPENVIAYVGLAAIFEQQHLLDEAIWHLERAYEIAPGNFEIHKELLRYYSEVESRPRQRLKLTLAGLARLYAQEGLHSQAIQEFRAIATESPARFDVRVALAETLWHVGRIREAADVAQSLIAQLPYCLKANLILGVAWKESGLPDSEMFLARAQELDPTNKIAQRLFGSRSPLIPARVVVPRYVKGAAPPPAPLPTPMRVGEQVSEELTPPPGELLEETPLDVSAAPEPEIEDAALAIPMDAESVPKPDLPVVNLPPWLRTEPSESIGTFPAAPVPEPEAAEETYVAPPAWLSEPEESAGKTSEAALPAWLTQTPTDETRIEPSAEEETRAEAEVPAWMRGIEQVSAAEEKAEMVEPPASEEVPDWLRQLQAETVPPAEPAREPEPELPPGAEYPMPDFLAPASPEPAAPPIVVETPAEEKPKRKRQPKGYARLVQARAYRDAGRLADALEEYDYLVQRAPRLVNEIIDDLEMITARADAPLDAQRILGDAYTRADRLSEALERYQFVLERTQDKS
jgi:tetratricopeptide (TPR) repeat protein